MIAGFFDLRHLDGLPVKHNRVDYAHKCIYLPIMLYQWLLEYMGMSLAL